MCVILYIMFVLVYFICVIWFFFIVIILKNYKIIKFLKEIVKSYKNNYDNFFVLGFLICENLWVININIYEGV